jgi:hypothetical protein
MLGQRRRTISATPYTGDAVFATLEVSRSVTVVKDSDYEYED